MSERLDPQVFRAYIDTFESPEGRIVLRNLKEMHFIQKPLISKGPLDPLTMAYAEGQRNVILRILTIIQEKE